MSLEAPQGPKRRRRSPASAVESPCGERRHGQHSSRCEGMPDPGVHGGDESLNSHGSAACTVGSSSVAGILKWNVLPTPAALSTPILPPCASTMALAIASPSPAPSTVRPRLRQNVEQEWEILGSNACRELAASFGSRLTLLRVTSPLALQLSSDPTGGYPLADPTARGRRAAVHYLNGVAAQLRERGLTVEAHVSEELSPAPAIVDYANTHGVDLVALTTTGAGSIRRLLLGSVADHVIRKGETPVLACNTTHMEGSAADDTPAAATAAELEC